MANPSMVRGRVPWGPLPGQLSTAGALLAHGMAATRRAVR